MSVDRLQGCVWLSCDADDCHAESPIVDGDLWRHAAPAALVAGWSTSERGRDLCPAHAPAVH